MVRGSTSPVVMTMTINLRRPIVIVGAIFVAIGLIAILYAITRKTTGNMSQDQAEKVSDVAVLIDGQIRVARLGTRLVGDNISSAPKLRAAVLVDAKTVENQVASGQIPLPHRGEDEIIEFGRITRAVGKAEVLAIQPADSPHRSHDGVAGKYADIADGKVFITEVVKIDPTDKADLYTGYLSMSRVLNVSSLFKYLYDAGITGKLIVGDKSIPIGEIPTDATTLELPIGSQPGAKFIIAGPPSQIVPPLPVLIGGIGSVVIGVLLLVINIIVQRAIDRSRVLARR